MTKTFNYRADDVHFQTLDDVCSIQKIAHHWCVHPNTVRYWIDEHYIIAKQPDDTGLRDWIVSINSVIEYRGLPVIKIVP